MFVANPPNSTPLHCHLFPTVVESHLLLSPLKLVDDIELSVQNCSHQSTGSALSFRHLLSLPKKGGFCSRKRSLAIGGLLLVESSAVLIDTFVPSTSVVSKEAVDDCC
jgi:hypothetical protein